MKFQKVFIIIIFLSININTSTLAQNIIVFDVNTWKNTLEKAQKQKKNILLYGSVKSDDWCIKFERAFSGIKVNTTLKKDLVLINYYNSNFIKLKLDIKDSSNFIHIKNLNLQISKPFFAVLNPYGDILYYNHDLEIDYSSNNVEIPDIDNEILNVIPTIKHKINSRSSAETDFILKSLEVYIKNSISTDSLLDIYLAKEENITQENFLLIAQYCTKANSRAFHLLEKKFERFTSPKSVLQYCAFYKSLISTISVSSHFRVLFNDLLNKWLLSQSPETWLSDENWDIISNYYSNTDTKIFDFIIQNYEKISNKYGILSVNNGLVNIHKRFVFNVFWFSVGDNKLQYEIQREQFFKAYPDSIEAEKILLMEDLFFYEQVGLWDKYSKSAIRLMKINYRGKPYLNLIAKNFIYYIDDEQSLKEIKHLIEKAINGSLRSYIDNDSEYEVNLYYSLAYLMYKLKDYEEAKKQAEIAKNFAAERKLDIIECEDLIEKILKK